MGRTGLSALAIALCATGAVAHGEVTENNYFSKPMEHAFVNRPPLPVQRSDMEVLDIHLVIDEEERFLVTGGCVDEVQDGDCVAISGDAFFYYPDRAEEPYETIAAMPTPRMRHSTVLRDDKVYVFGGATVGLDFARTIDVLSLSTLSWSTLPVELPENITDGVAFAHDTDVFYTGGWLPSKGYNLSEASFRVNVNDTLLEDGPLLNTPRGDARLVMFEGKPTVMGGFGPNPLASLEVLEPNLQWVVHEFPMEVARGDFGAAVLHDRIYVFGGESYSEEAENGFVSERIEVFDPIQNKWHHAGEVDIPRHRFAAFATDRSIFLMGGQVVKNWSGAAYSSSFTLLDNVEEFIERSDLYDIPVVAVHGAGTTNPMHLFYDIMHMMERQSRVPTRFTYRAVGSTTGKAEFVGNKESVFMPANHFGSGDVPLDKSQYDTVTRHGHGVLQIPFAFGAVGIFVNVPEQRASGEDIVLTACQLAKIYRGELTKWSELATDSVNTFLQGVDNPITAGHRTKGSSSTSAFTNWLYSSCSDEWGEDLAGSSVTWPCSEEVCPAVEGSQGMQALLQNNEYTLGYLSIGHSYPDQIREAALVNRRGKAIRSSSEAIQAASKGAKWPEKANESFHEVDLVDSNDEEAWPMVLVSYIYIREDLSAYGSTSALLIAFIEYVLGETLSGDDLNSLPVIQRYGFVRPPQDIVALGLDGLRGAELPINLQRFSFETATAPLTGAQPWVISSKRSDFTSSELDRLQDELSKANSRMVALESQLAGSSGENAQAGPSAVAIAALVLGILAVLLGVVLLVKVSDLKSRLNQAEDKQNAYGFEPGTPRRGSMSSHESTSAAVREVQMS